MQSRGYEDLDGRAPRLVRHRSINVANVLLIVFLLALATSRPARAESKSPVIAGALSLVVPGAGQIYEGRVGTGLAFLGSEATMVFISGTPVVRYLGNGALHILYNVTTSREAGDRPFTKTALYAAAAIHLYNVVDAIRYSHSSHIGFSGPISHWTLTVAPRITSPPMPQLCWSARF